MKTIRHLTFGVFFGLIALGVVPTGSSNDAHAMRDMPNKSFFQAFHDCDVIEDETYPVEAPHRLQSFAMECVDTYSDWCASDSWLHTDAGWLCMTECYGHGASDYSYDDNLCNGTCICDYTSPRVG